MNFVHLKAVLIFRGMSSYWCIKLRLMKDHNICSPEHYVTRGVFHWYKTGFFEMHSHPQIRQCPFCMMNFTVIGSLESLSNDTKYLKTKLKPHLNSVKENLKYNQNPKTISKEFRFWSCIKPKTVRKVIEMYQDDFYVFEYEDKNYFQNLNLGYKLL